MSLNAPIHGAPRPPRPCPPGSSIDLWFMGVIAATSVALVVLMLRVVQLQIRPSGRLAQHIDERATTAPEPGVRGDILDRRGRLLAGSRFGHRVFIDPVQFPMPPDESMQRLADASGIAIEVIAQKLIPKIAENERRLGAHAEPISTQPELPDSGPSMEPDQGAGAIAPTSLALDEGGEGGDLEFPGGATTPAPSGASKSPRLIRYVSLGGILDDWRVNMVQELKIPGVHLELRGVREQTTPELTAALLGVVGVEHEGRLGAERVFDQIMRPKSGRLRYIRDAARRPLWVEQGGYTAPERGHDAKLSIDLELQRALMEELKAGVEKADAAGGRAVLVDPRTGEVVAICDFVRHVPGAVAFNWDNPTDTRRKIVIPNAKEAIANPLLAHNRCVEDVYEPGSTFKPFMWSMTTELGLADPDEMIDTEDGVWVTPYGRTVRDVVKKPHMTWAQVLVNSSNIGMSKVTRRMSDKQMRDAVVGFGFGTRSDIGLPGESPGLVTTQKAWGKYTQTSVASGHEVAVTPIQMARAFCAFARTGKDAGTMPRLRLTAVDPLQAPLAEPVRVLTP
ncbi:MAG: hypothetical protein H7Y88_07585, partial [Phycisphaerales bacterium]|nr:hypothetical protein [Phycisphaerales bacterium]